jgi:hypothetical protein
MAMDCAAQLKLLRFKNEWGVAMGVARNFFVAGVGLGVDRLHSYPRIAACAKHGPPRHPTFNVLADPAGSYGPANAYLRANLLMLLERGPLG